MKITALLLSGIFTASLSAAEPVLPVQIYNFHIDEYLFTPNEKHPTVTIQNQDEISIVNTLKTIGDVQLLSKKDINILRGDPTSISDIKKVIPYEMCFDKKCASLVAEEGYYLDLLPSIENDSIFIDTRYKYSTIYAMEKVSGSKNPIPRTFTMSQTGQYTFGPSHTVVIGFTEISSNYNEPVHFLIITANQI